MNFSEQTHEIQMRNAIDNRISRRTFKTESIELEHIQRIQELIDKINAVSGLTLAFIEDGSAAFSSIKKTYGMFKNVRSLILMKGNPNTPDFKEKVGYYGEDLVLDLVDMNLGTCWVGGTFDKSVFSIPDDEYIVCVILVGLIDKPNLKDRIMMKNAHNKRKSIEERITSDAPLPHWLIEGMKAVIPAPSALNKQKPHFNFTKGVLTASVPNDYAADLIDLGIAKKHFETGAGGRFAFGNGAEYTK